MRLSLLLRFPPAATVVALLLVSRSYGQQPFTFDLAGNSAKITLARPADGLIPLRLIYCFDRALDEFIQAQLTAP
jgi:hypothetical protein